MARYDTAGNIINQAAAEVGLVPVTNPFTSVDPAFQQMIYLLTAAGRELLGSHQWQRFVKRYSITTTTASTYDLPADYGWFIDQTGWNPVSGGNGLPLGGPLTEQDYAYLVSTNLASSTIYISFREADGQIAILPSPAPAGKTITFTYMSRYWVAATGAPTTPVADSVALTTDVVLFEPTLITKLLKLRFLEAKGFDTTAAVTQFANLFDQWTGKDTTTAVLNTARVRTFPYLGWRNVPETNYGLP